MYSYSGYRKGLSFACRRLLLASALTVAGVISASSLLHAAENMATLPHININPVKAVPPEPTYFPDEAHDLNKKAPAAGNSAKAASQTDEAMIGSMVLEPNPAYPERSALIRLQEIRKEQARTTSRDEEQAADFGGLENKLETLPDSPVLEPKAAWLVGPAKASQLSEGDPQGCIALNQFSNEFIMGIHASGKEILGITVDTRQSVFKSGEVYPVAMSLGDDSYALMALGSNQSTIAISLEDVPAFSYKAKQVGVIRLVIGATPMYFSTTGLADGLKRMQDCLEDRGTKTLKVENSTSGDPVVQAIGANADYFAPGFAPEDIAEMAIEREGKNVPITLAVTELIPSGHRFVIERGIDPMMKISWEKGPIWIEVLAKAMRTKNLYVHLHENVVTISKTPPVQTEDMPEGLRSRYSAVVSEDGGAKAARPVAHTSYEAIREWTAEEGESLDTILEDWAQQAGVRLVLELDKEFVLDAPFVYEGRFEDAAHVLMGRFEGKGDLPRMMFKSPVTAGSARDAQIRAAAGTSSRLNRYSDLMGKPAPQLEKIGRLPSKNYYGQPSPPQLDSATWRGLEGASLRSLLEEWTDKAGVDLVWDMDQMIELKESVKMQGSFTDAVAGVLQQYAGDPLRPVAQLNNDPMTRQKTLIIRLAGKTSHMKQKPSGAKDEKNEDDKDDDS